MMRCAGSLFRLPGVRWAESAASSLLIRPYHLACSRSLPVSNEAVAQDVVLTMGSRTTTTYGQTYNFYGWG